MMSMKIIQLFFFYSYKLSNFQDPPPPMHLRPKFFHLLDHGRPVSNEPPPPNDIQSVKMKLYCENG